MSFTWLSSLEPAVPKLSAERSCFGTNLFSEPDTRSDGGVIGAEEGFLVRGGLGFGREKLD
jgi:hypothetical protein